MSIELIDKAKEFQAMLKTAEAIVALVPKLQGVKVDGHEALPHAIAVIEKMAEHIKVLMADFQELERLAGAEFEVIRGLFPKQEAKE